MGYREYIEQYLEKSGGIITASYCRSNKIPTVYLSRLVQEGTLQRVTEGLYVSEEGMYDDYFTFQYRFRQAIFSYETALHLLGVTDIIPQEMNVTVYNSYKFNRTPDRVTPHYVHKEIHELGVVEARTMFNNPVRVYSFERTLCDFIAHEDSMDREVYVKILRSYPTYAQRDISTLYEIATRMGINRKVKALMEVVYE